MYRRRACRQRSARPLPLTKFSPPLQRANAPTSRGVRADLLERGEPEAARLDVPRLPRPRQLHGHDSARNSDRQSNWSGIRTCQERMDVSARVRSGWVHLPRGAGGGCKRGQ